MSDREALKRSIDDLSSMGVRFVARMVDSLADPPRVQFPESEPTWITAEPDWIEYFGLMISAHHGITVEALGLTSFETAFRNTCGAVDWALEAPGSATQRFVDLTVEAADGPERRLSLKSTAAQRLSETTAHISKLTEAAWIQDVRSARTRKEHTLELFEEYCAAVDAIVMLLTTDRPAPKSAGHRALSALTGPGKPIRAVIGMLSPEDLEHLAELSSGDL